MKFFYIFYYVFCYVYIAQLGHLATFCANGVGLCCSVALLIFWDGPELVVRNQIGLNEHCNSVVYGSAAHTKFILFQVLHQLLYLKTAVDWIDCIEDCKTLGCASAFVLFQIFCKYLVRNFHNPATFHTSLILRKECRWASLFLGFCNEQSPFRSFNTQSYCLFLYYNG